MQKRSLRAHGWLPVVEALENRQLLSATGGIVSAVVPDQTDGPAVNASIRSRAGVSLATTTELKLSKRLTKLGQSLRVSVVVKSSKGAPVPAGTVQLIDNGTTVGGTDPLVLTLSPAGRASYTLGAGNVALYPGLHTLSALYTPSVGLLGSLSKPEFAKVVVPKLNRRSDGLGTATIQAGHGAAIHDGQQATVLYTGILQANGEVFDYASAHAAAGSPNLSFTVGATPLEVIQGFNDGVRGMKVGETRLIVIPSALGYGPGGSGNNIPANADLLFLVKLQGITAPSA